MQSLQQNEELSKYVKPLHSVILTRLLQQVILFLFEFFFSVSNICHNEFEDLFHVIITHFFYCHFLPLPHKK